MLVNGRDLSAVSIGGPAGHRLVPLRLGQVGQVPGIAAGHLSSVTPSRFPMWRYRRIRHPGGLPASP